MDSRNKILTVSFSADYYNFSSKASKKVGESQTPQAVQTN